MAGAGALVEELVKVKITDFRYLKNRGIGSLLVL